MIISASRRTDIPAYYSDWFFGRIREGFVLTRNPRNYHQVSKISLAIDDVDGIVFWTKNPSPMLARLNKLNDFMYYFQFTLTPYGKDIEPNLPSKNDFLISTFKRLSAQIGEDRVIWRYDPVLINPKYTTEYHIRAFDKIAKELCGYTQKVIFSFVVPDYRGVKGNIKELGLSKFPDELKIMLASQLAQIAHGYGLSIAACALPFDLTQCGIEKARCVDSRLFSKLLGRDLVFRKDKNQREECGCAVSVDIGVYNTCKNGCRYCYANYSPGSICDNVSIHNPLSAFMIGESHSDDKIKARNL